MELRYSTIHGAEDVPPIPDLPCKAEDICAFGLCHLCDINDFWDACRPWLAREGFALWNIRPRDPLDKWQREVWLCPQTTTATATSPLHAAHLGKYGDGDSPCFIAAPNLRLGYARDREGRDVMLKLVGNRSTEYNINRLLLQQTEPLITDNATFPCVLPPVTILDTPHGYAIIVLPMWGSPIYLEDSRSCGEILHVMRCLLRGLSFLHEHRIVHRDICEHNIVVNVHSPGNVGDEYRELLHKYRRGHEVLYALMDFDQSLQLPADTPMESCRRPALEADFGNALYKPSDIVLGEPYYNPFALDVGMMGHFFQYHFAEAVPQVPGLAALFDSMTDHSIPRRLTARQALQFLDNIESSLSHDTLKTSVTLQPSFDPTNNAALYWSKLSAADVLVWGKYRRARSRSILRRIMGWVASYPLGWRVVRSVRWMLRL